MPSLKQDIYTTPEGPMNNKKGRRRNIRSRRWGEGLKNPKFLVQHGCGHHEVIPALLLILDPYKLRSPNSQLWMENGFTGSVTYADHLSASGFSVKGREIESSFVPTHESVKLWWLVLKSGSHRWPLPVQNKKQKKKWWVWERNQ